MTNPQNIIGKEFKPGQSGNPNGRPPGIPNASTRYQRLLKLTQKIKNPVTGDLEDFTLAEIMDMRQFQKATKGDTKAYQEIMNRLEGRPKESVDVTSGGEKLDPIVVYRPEKLKEE